jgi:hypothetical protein
MQRAIIVRGRLTEARRIDLDEPVEEMAGEIEVTVRLIEPERTAPAQDMLDFLRSLPPGTRSKEDIDSRVYLVVISTAIPAARLRAHSSSTRSRRGYRFQVEPLCSQRDPGVIVD